MPPMLIHLVYGPMNICQLYVIWWGGGTNILIHAVTIELPF